MLCSNFDLSTTTMGVRKWLNVSAYVLVQSVVGRMIVCATCVLFTLTMLTIRLLSESHWLAPAGADDWFTKGRVMCYHVYMIMHVKYPLHSVLRVGHHVLSAGFWLSLYSLHMLKRDVNIIQIHIHKETKAQLYIPPDTTSKLNTTYSSNLQMYILTD